MFHSKCYISKEIAKWKTADKCGQVWSYPAVHIFHGKMLENVIKDVTEYYSQEPTNQDIQDPLMEEFLTKMVQNACAYVSKCAMFPGIKEVEINKVWDVKMLPGDYEFLHEHETKSKEGLSSIFYLKVPDNGTDSDHLWPNGSENDFDSVQKDEITGHGLLKFRWGLSSVQNSDSFSCPDNVTIIPKIGHFYIFPKSLHHEVIPCDKNEDRWSVQIDFNCWTEGEKPE